jgi:hypothetical protein
MSEKISADARTIIDDARIRHELNLERDKYKKKMRNEKFAKLNEIEQGSRSSFFSGIFTSAKKPGLTTTNKEWLKGREEAYKQKSKEYAARVKKEALNNEIFFSNLEAKKEEQLKKTQDNREEQFQKDMRKLKDREKLHSTVATETYNQYRRSRYGHTQSMGLLGGGSKSKEILGKIRRVYKVAGSRKEHIKYKGNLIPVADYKKLMK